jgi:hypothetical protein
MKFNSISLMDVLTVVLFVPFALVILVGTGLILYVVIEWDTSDSAGAQEYAEPRIRRYIVLPTVTPAAIEAAEVELDHPLAETQEPVAQIVDAASPDAATAAEIVTAPALVEEPAATEDTAPAQDDIEVQAETEPPDEPPAEVVALAEPELPDTSDDESLPDEEETPPTPVPTTEPILTMPKPTPPPPRSTEPAPVPDVSFFDDLLEQVKQ